MSDEARPGVHTVSKGRHLTGEYFVAVDGESVRWLWVACDVCHSRLRLDQPRGVEMVGQIVVLFTETHEACGEERDP